MTTFDSHAHFPSETIAGHEAQIARARAAGLAGILAVGGGESLDEGTVTMVRRFPGYVFLALGLDRDCAVTLAETPSALKKTMADLRSRISALNNEGIPLHAIGETGLDFSRNPTEPGKEAQIALFEAQLELAGELGLPCTIHSRDAEHATLALVERHGSRDLRAHGRLGVIHCFTGGKEFADAATALGLHIGVSGIFTFNNASDLRGTVCTLPRERLLVETDCPYLTPVPMRGKPNEPAMLVHTVTRLARELGITPEEIGAITTANAMRLFSPENA